MTLGEKPRKSFGIFSLLGRKSKDQGTDQAQSHHQASHIQHSARGQSTRPSHQAAYSHHDAGHHAQAPPAPTTEKHGFYPSVQYERLVPSVSQRPPTTEPRHPSPNVYEGSAVQYERLTSSSSTAPSASSVQYERLTSAPASSVPIKYERIAPSGAFLHSPAPLPVQAPKTSMTSPLPRLPSPGQFEHASDPGRYQLTAPSPSLPSPSLSSLPSPGMLTPLTAQMGQMSVDVSKQAYRAASHGPVPPSVAPPRATASPDTIMAEGVTPDSDGSTPFAAVMGEWISQRRTPTPDVTLLPSPFAFNQDTPTPVERVDDLNRIHDALLPTPPPDLHAHSQSTKSQEYLRSVGRRPLLEDIASLCRDLIHQESGKALPSLQQLRVVEEKPYPEMGRGKPESVYDDDDDESAADTSRSGKSKRRKMCSADGCANLSRSRGLCKAHGGGRRCTVEGCSRASQSGSLCITHGGGKRCTVDGCEKAAQSRGMCKAHGGGVRCRVDGCQKSSQGDGFCRSHGGGRRCGHASGCTKWAQRNGMCMAHSEGKYGNSYRGRLNRMQEEQQTS